MHVDPSNDSLWVASAAAPFMINATPAEAGVSILARIDLARGRVTASYQLAGSGLLERLSRGGWFGLRHRIPWRHHLCVATNA